MSILASETSQKLTLYFSSVGTSLRRLKVTFDNLVYSPSGPVFKCYKCYSSSPVFNQEIQQMVTVGRQMYSSAMHIVGAP